MSNKEEIYPATKLRKPDSLYQFQSNSNSQLQTVKEMSGFLYASPVQKHDIAEDNSMPQPISKSIQKNCIDRGKAMEELAGSIKMISNESLTNSYPDNSNFKIERYFNALREDRLKDTSEGKEKKWGKLFVKKKKDEIN